MPPIRSFDAAPTSPPHSARVPRTAMLVVEDRVELRDSLRFLLERFGHEVLLAGSAEEGLAVLRARSDIGVLLTDIGLPGLDGWHFAREARALYRGLGVIYMSGHAGGEWQVQGVPGSMFLGKPFEISNLLAAMGTVLSPDHR